MSKRPKGPKRAGPRTFLQYFSLFIGAVLFLAGALPLAEKVAWWLQPPKLAIQSVDTYAVEVDSGVFQVGIIAKIANLDEQADLLNAVTFDGASLDIAGRGAAFIQEIHRPLAFAELAHNQLLKPGESDNVKLLLPLRIRMSFKPPLPELLVWGRWQLQVKRGPLRRNVAELVPDFVGSFEAPLSLEEWTSKSGMALEQDRRVQRRFLAKRFDSSALHASVLLFNADRSATLDEYGFDRTNPATSPAGIMVWLRGPGSPTVPLGWTVLGASYPQVWADRGRLAIYNAVHPPDQMGRPRPFAAFAGCEDEMGVTESVPVTRGRTILNVRLLNRSEFDPARPTFIRFVPGGVEYATE